MFYFLSFSFKNSLFFANVLHYTSFRAIAALLTSFLVSLVIGTWFISYWASFFRSKIREYTPETHKGKDNMPTMGGMLIVSSVVSSLLLWSDVSNPLLFTFLVAFIGFALIGAADDWYKITTHRGISARTKFIAQWAMAALAVGTWVWLGGAQTTVSFPFFKYLTPDIGLFFIPWACFVMVSCSNAVNLTDGLDGLAIGSLLPNFALYSVIAYLAGHFMIAHYLSIPFAGSAEVTVMGASLIGACLGFLWYNTYPAQVFMGDVGSLALGAALATMALFAKQELLLPLSGGIFMVETVSVLLQVYTYRRWKKRIFKMAPLHHHFELLGWQEAKITIRFAIISLILCLLALITIKLR